MFLIKNKQPEPAGPPGTAARMVLLPPDWQAIVSYFESQAPDHLPALATWPAPDQKVAFKKRVMSPPNAGRSPAVANIELVDLRHDGRLEIVFTDMRYGGVYTATIAEQSPCSPISPSSPIRHTSTSRLGRRRYPRLPHWRPRPISAIGSSSRRRRVAARAEATARYFDARRSTDGRASPTSRPRTSTATASSIWPWLRSAGDARATSPFSRTHHRLRPAIVLAVPDRQAHRRNPRDSGGYERRRPAGRGRRCSRRSTRRSWRSSIRAACGSTPRRSTPRRTPTGDRPASRSWISTRTATSTSS